MRLFEHQESGIQYLYERTRAYLGDPPGFGKTRIACHAAAYIPDARPLVVCPAIVRTHWDREFRQWAPSLKPLIVSYDHIVRGGVKLMAELLTAPQAPNLLILDEAHYLKHPSSQRSRLLLGKDGYARRMTRVWALSGTPTPKNNPLEYWTVLASLFPEVALRHGLSNAAQFEATFCVTTTRMVRGVETKKVIGIRNAERLLDLMSETMLRRSPAELEFTMPPVFKQFLPLDLNEDIEEPEISDSLTTTEMLFDPAVARYRRKVGEAKVTPVLEVLKSQLAGSSEKVVVFAHHRTVLAALKEGLADFGVAYIDGDVGQPARAVAIESFQNDSKVRVFLGQTIACHTGITLTAAHRVVLVEPDWTDAVNVQAAARVARIGQDRNFCIVQYVVAANTLDEGIIRSLARESRNGDILYATPTPEET